MQQSTQHFLTDWCNQSRSSLLHYIDDNRTCPSRGKVFSWQYKPAGLFQETTSTPVTKQASSQTSIASLCRKSCKHHLHGIARQYLRSVLKSFLSRKLRDHLFDLQERARPAGKDADRQMADALKPVLSFLSEHADCAHAFSAKRSERYVPETAPYAIEEDLPGIEKSCA